MNTNHQQNTLFVTQLLALSPLLIMCDSLALAMYLCAISLLSLAGCVLLTKLTYTRVAMEHQPIADIMVIAGIVSICELLLKTHSYRIFENIGFLLPLVAIHCSLTLSHLKNAPVGKRARNVWMTFVPYMAILCIGALREIFSTGKLFDITVLVSTELFVFALLPSMGFILMGSLLALHNTIWAKRHLTTDVSDESYKLRRVRITGIIN